MPIVRDVGVENTPEHALNRVPHPLVLAGVGEARTEGDEVVGAVRHCVVTE